MKKLTLLLASLFLFVGCSKANREESQKESQDESSSDVVVSSEETSSSEVISSEESSIEESSEEASSEASSSETSSEEELLSYSLNVNAVPAQEGSGYPDDQDITDSGFSFSISDIFKNTGKFSTTTIQFKKQTGTIKTKTALYKNVVIEVMKNYISYSDTDLTGELSVYAGNDVSSLTNKLEFTEEKGETVYTYSYANPEGYRFFKIVNETGNAQYAKSITWSTK